MAGEKPREMLPAGCGHKACAGLRTRPWAKREKSELTPPKIRKFTSQENLHICGLCPVKLVGCRGAQGPCISCPRDECPLPVQSASLWRKVLEQEAVDTCAANCR